MRTSPKLAVALLLALPMAALAQGLGIDLGGSKPAEKKAEPAPAPAKPAAPLTLDALNVAGRTAGRQRMDAAKKLYDEKAWESAAVAFDEILRDRTLAAEHDEARYRLAQSLERMGLYYSAFSRYEEILAKGPQGTKYYYNALDGLFSSARHMANDRVVLAGAARFGSEKMPAEYQARLDLLLARYHYERGRALLDAGQQGEARRELEEARKLAAQVAPGATSATLGPDAGSPTENLAARARFVDGTALYALGRQAEALEAFKEVVRLTNPRKTSRTDARVRELAFLQLARIHYEHKQNRYAIWYFGKMPWGERLWLEGLWESSYAHYRIGDYEKALGNLLTLHSPFFVDEYFPESYILKSVIYFENCRYPEARAILEDFTGRYEPVYQELVRITARKVPASAFYEEIEQGEKGKATDRGSLLRKVLKIALTDDAISRLNESILQIEAEMDDGVGGRGRFARTGLGEELLVRLKADRARLVEEAGARARQKLESERDDLKRLLEQGLRIKIEVSRKEREALEASLAKGAPVNVLRPYKYTTAVSDEHEYWPYEGESWRDELGTYSYTLTRGCREGPARATSP
ncbi:MAG TPA: adventurous gliding motility protein GltC [Anaeromyxobacteraceae bacterium]|nr:adventurous gliding motility protein GltC [Anaeromyxobacteraceae bacterium]